MTKKIKLDFYSVEVKYSGAFEDYTSEDWKAMATKKAEMCDAYDDTIEVDSMELALEVERKFAFVADNEYPCNKLARVKWVYIREEDEDDE